jgi:hypothetical protein
MRSSTVSLDFLPIAHMLVGTECQTTSHRAVTNSSSCDLRSRNVIDKNNIDYSSDQLTNSSSPFSGSSIMGQARRK